MEEAFRKLFFDACTGALKSGPGIIIAILILYGVYRLIIKLASGVGAKIVAALEKPSLALDLQAKSMERLTISLEAYVARDRNEHREIIILQKVISDKLETVVDQLKELKDERRKERTL